jgi:hexosaminidase
MLFVRSFFIGVLLSGLLVLFVSCREPYPPTDLTNHGIIPKPVAVAATNGTFLLDEDAAIYVDEGDEGLMKNAEFLASLLRPATGYDIDIKETNKEPRKGNIYFTTKAQVDTTLGPESYTLTISEQMVKISSPTPSGIFYGIQSLRQLLPAKIETVSSENVQWFLPTGTIRDWPQYGYRGMMLDVARHFFQVEEVKRVIDYLTLYKINHLHLHLSDDQGWRIEIESWPNLTKHGGSTQVGGGKGGFFSKNDYKEIVRYAADRHITIVPEIDMPGHTNAALSSYPELNCDGQVPKLYTGTRVGFSTLCTEKEVVYEFVDDVIREICEMTPGPYFHVGGDESHSTADDDYVRFINRVRKIVDSYGKRMIGWDEIAHSDIAEGDIVQFWSKEENAFNGSQKGAKVLMSPSKHAYLDMKYDSASVLGLDWAGHTDVEDGYSWNPVKLVDGIVKIDIIGVEAPLWSETMETLDDIEYLMFPRLPGHAEIGWTPYEKRRWEEYKTRLGLQKNRFEALQINYYKSPLVPWQDEKDIFIEQKVDSIPK